jgi:hypothetical protein
VPHEGLTPWFQWVKAHHEAGTLHEVLGNLSTTVLSVMKLIGFQNSSAVTDTWIRAYAAPFSTRDECIGAMEFPLDALLRRIVPYVKEGLSGVQPRSRRCWSSASTTAGSYPSTRSGTFEPCFHRNPS